MSDLNTRPCRRRLHPFCRKCGWRMGGVDSWDGMRCKCGFSAEPIPEPANDAGQR